MVLPEVVQKSSFHAWAHRHHPKAPPASLLSELVRRKNPYLPALTDKDQQGPTSNVRTPEMTPAHPASAYERGPMMKAAIRRCWEFVDGFEMWWLRLELRWEEALFDPVEYL